MWNRGALSLKDRISAMEAERRSREVFLKRQSADQLLLSSLCRIIFRASRSSGWGGRYGPRVSFRGFHTRPAWVSAATGRTHSAPRKKADGVALPPARKTRRAGYARGTRGQAVGHDRFR